MKADIASFTSRFHAIPILMLGSTMSGAEITLGGTVLQLTMNHPFLALSQCLLLALLRHHTAVLLPQQLM
jgi:hypothetical protein